MEAKKVKKIIFFLFLFYLILISLLCFLKYQNFLYNAVDLAIYNQVFWNTVKEGKWFFSSIQQENYLSNHFEPFLFLLLPLYKLFPHPFSLLFWQTFFLGLGIWPLYLLSKELKLKKIKIGSKEIPFSLILSIFYLFNPFLLNIALFEFHLLAFAPFFLFFTFYFFQKRRIFPFFTFFFLSLLIREDISLILLTFSLLSLFDSQKRKNFKEITKWAILPFLLALFWFISSQKIIEIFSGGEKYKFLVYYNWLGEDFGAILKFILLHPFKIISHLLKPKIIIPFLALLIPFAFLPLFSLPILLAFFPFFEFALGREGGGEIMILGHYSALFLPSLFLAFIFSFKKRKES